MVINVQEKTLHAWLSSSGGERIRAADEAAEVLLRVYRKSCSSAVPVAIERLAQTLGAQVSWDPSLRPGAWLTPREDGFLILVGYPPMNPRYPSSIAHELAHTLFYTADGAAPRRALPATKKEEDFCFDVARRLIAPRWLVSDVLSSRHHPSTMEVRDVFYSLLEPMHLSMPTAARLMLADYELAVGVAGYWSKNSEGDWTLIQGKAYASPCLDRSQRQKIRDHVKDWLNSRGKVRGEIDGFSVFSLVPPRRDSVFVVAARMCDDGISRLARGTDGTLTEATVQLSWRMDDTDEGV